MLVTTSGVCSPLSFSGEATSGAGSSAPLDKEKR